MSQALEVLLNSINAQIESFNENDFKAYDRENDGFYLSGISYCKDKDKLFLNFKEEE